MLQYVGGYGHDTTLNGYAPMLRISLLEHNFKRLIYRTHQFCVQTRLSCLDTETKDLQAYTHTYAHKHMCTSKHKCAYTGTHGRKQTCEHVHLRTKKETLIMFAKNLGDN